ncbi:hypothetical protein HaloA020_29960 [Halomonas sp. A020]|nr:hypothetical protein HaloA020_29960 [Halomonas sp. A020]
MVGSAWAMPDMANAIARANTRFINSPSYWLRYQHKPNGRVWTFSTFMAKLLISLDGLDGFTEL